MTEQSTAIRPSSRRSDLRGLQLYAYDVLDEGPEHVVDGALLAGTSVLLLAVSYCDRDVELKPGRGGDLRHNPVRARHLTDAFFCGDPPSYPGFLPAETGVDGRLALEWLLPVATEKGLEVVPWVTLLTQSIAYDLPESCVVNARGESVPGWLCPTRPETRDYVCALMDDLTRSLGPSAIFLDRIRFPEWGPRGLVDLATCFCDCCYSAAGTRGIDLDGARSNLLEVVDLLEHDPLGAAESGLETFSSGLGTLRASASHTALLDWLRFRHLIVEELVSMASETAAAKGVEVWLDVWPPSYGWILGQDLALLAPWGVWTKPFTYHRWGGGADVAGFIDSASDDHATRQRLYEVFRSFFSFPTPEHFVDFADHGLHPTFVTSELSFASQLLNGRSKLAAGLQLWGVGPPGVEAALTHAWMAHPHGVIFHCYGWATHEELAAAGTWLNENAHGRSRIPQSQAEVL